MDLNKIKRYRGWDLLPIAESYGFEFQPVGGKLRGLCKFHGDTGNPNLFIYPDDNTWFCFACRRGHTKSQFVAYAEKVPRKVIDGIWDRDTDIRELLDVRLKQRVINYRESLLLLLSKFCYDNRSRNTLPYTKRLAELDREISAKPFIDLTAYTRFVKLIEELKNNG
jgi:hypothetical protein